MQQGKIPVVKVVKWIAKDPLAQATVVIDCLQSKLGNGCVKNALTALAPRVEVARENHWPGMPPNQIHDVTELPGIGFGAERKINCMNIGNPAFQYCFAGGNG